MYNRAFIRSYCEYLGIDPEPMLARYENETAPPAESSVKASPVQGTGFPFKFHPLAVWSLMLLASATGLYISRKWVADIFSPYLSHSSAPGTLVSSSPAPPPFSKPRQPATGAPVMPAASEVISQRADVTSPSPAGQTSIVSVPPGTIRLEFEVLEQCWVSVNRDGDRVLVKILKPGDDQSFDATGSLSLILGNAGGVRLKINGQSVKPLGRAGEVVHLLINEQNIKDLVEKTSG